MTLHRPTTPHLARLAGWRAAVLWLLLVLPWAQAWLVCHEFSHRPPSTGGVQSLAQDDNRAAKSPQRSDLNDAHSACLLCLAGSALTHAAGPMAALTGRMTTALQHAEPTALATRWTPPAPRHYASRAPPLKA